MKVNNVSANLSAKTPNAHPHVKTAQFQNEAPVEKHLEQHLGNKLNKHC